jgi:phage gp36-like protein
MAFITATEVVARLGAAAALQLTTDSGTTPDTAMITTIVGQVEGRVHGYLRKRIAVDLTSATYPVTYAAVQGVVMDMTIYTLALRRPPVPKDWTAANERAEKWLAGVADGSIELPDVGLGTGMECGYADQNAAGLREL